MAQEEMYKELASPLPKEAIQKALAKDTKKGYDTTGIGYQFAVNRFNEICGLDKWGFEWKILKEIQGAWRTGGVNFECIAEVSIWIGNKENIRSCVGSHLASSYGDALKGAITNAFKKTASFWGVGRQAYEGTLDEDYQPRPQGEDDRISTESTTPLQETPPKIADKDPISKNKFISIENLRKANKVDEQEFKAWLLAMYGIEHRTNIPNYLWHTIIGVLKDWKHRPTGKPIDNTEPIETKKDREIRKATEMIVRQKGIKMNWADWNLLSYEEKDEWIEKHIMLKDEN